MVRRQYSWKPYLGKVLAAALLAAGGIALCIRLFLVFYDTSFLPEKVRYLVLAADGGMILAILWMLRCYYTSLEVREKDE